MLDVAFDVEEGDILDGFVWHDGQVEVRAAGAAWVYQEDLCGPVLLEGGCL